MKLQHQQAERQGCRIDFQDGKGPRNITVGADMTGNVHLNGDPDSQLCKLLGH